MRPLLITVLVLSCGFTLAQNDRDSTRQKTRAGKLVQQGIGFISSSPDTETVNKESSEPFRAYEGKIIRNIYVDFIGFERSIYDSTRRTRKIVSDIANALHTPTRERIIRNHLFFSKDKPLNPYILGDNERFLRDQSFIMDSRIVVTPTDSEDSVDVTVVTRDVFSLGVSLGGSPPAETKFSVYDANLFGGGQRLQLGGVIDVERTPLYGFSGLYRKSSLFGSLTYFEVGYSQNNEGRSYGAENEFASFVRLSRPLVSPYSRLAGGFEFSKNWSRNVFNEPDSAFLNYSYTVADAWIGYNIGIHKNIHKRSREFLAIRYFDGAFADRPEQPEYEQIPEYNDGKGVLAELTFYEQDFYKTNYIFGFGRTEDVPSGYRVSVSAGYLNILSVERPYVGLKSIYRKASRRGSFYELGFQAGTFFENGFDDTRINGHLAYFTRALNLGHYKMRALFKAGASTLSNRKTSNYVRVGTDVVHGFSADSLLGTQRVSASFEYILYTPWSFLGFRVAPFTGVDYARMNCFFCDEYWKNILGFNVGLRTRNENLIFGTIEIRFTYIPDTGFGESRTNYDFRQNVRVRNSGSFVNPPSLVRN